MTRGRRNSGARRARGSNQYADKWSNAPQESANRDRLEGVHVAPVVSKGTRSVDPSLETGEIVDTAVEAAGAALSAKRADDRLSYTENAYRLAEARSAISERHPNLYGAALASSPSRVATYKAAIDNGARLTKAQDRDYQVATELVSGSHSGMDEDRLTECLDHFVSVQRKQWDTQDQSKELTLRKRLAVLDGSSPSSSDSSSASEEQEQINRELEDMRIDQINF